MSKKKKIIIIVSVVLVVAIIGTIIGVKASANKGTAVSLYTIGTEDIKSVINATADVQAGSRREYKVAAAATVSEVFVKVGDRVTEGQLLATFDTSALDTQLKSLQEQYNGSKQTYNSVLASQKEAKEMLAKIDAEIANLEKVIAEQKAQESTTGVQQPTVPDGSNEINPKVTEIIQKAIKDAVANGKYTPEEINKAVQDALNEAIKNGEITPDDIANAGDINAKNTEELLKTIKALGASSQDMMLSVLKVQRQIYSASASDSVVETAKKAMNMNANALNTLKEQRDQLATGWTADFDGLISEVAITPGQTISLFTTGIALEGTDTMTAVITLGKYDIQKVSVGMPCKVSVVNGEYDGVVSFIAPTAEDNSGTSDVLNGLSSSFGISGLGSLTAGTSGVRCEITIKEPDEKIIIGLDANVEIILGTEKDVLAIPIESLKLDKKGKYCFVYDEDTGTVEKRELKVGSTSDTAYEVLKGLKAGEKIVATPTSDMQDGADVYITNDKSPKSALPWKK